MRILKLLAVPAMAFALSGCLDNDGERALAGAAGGAIVADALGGSAAAGAAAGAAGGALCDDAGICN